MRIIIMKNKCWCWYPMWNKSVLYKFCFKRSFTCISIHSHIAYRSVIWNDDTIRLLSFMKSCCTNLPTTFTQCNYSFCWFCRLVFGASDFNKNQHIFIHWHIFASTCRRCLLVTVSRAYGILGSGQSRVHKTAQLIT